MRPSHLTVLALLTAVSSSLGAQADSVPRAKFAVLPVLGSAPETGAQYGATVLRVFRTGPIASTRPSQLQLYAINTAEEQQRAFVQLDRWGAGNATRTRVRGEWQRFPLPYFAEGGGNDEAHFTARGPELSLLQLWRAGSAQYRGVGLRVRDLRVSDIDLADWRRAEAPDLVGSAAVTAQAVDLRDTRDHILGPSAGSFRQFTLGATRARDHAPGHRQRSSLRLAADLRRYDSLGSGVLALRASGEVLAGTAPFDLVPSAGSDTLLRGYVRGRVRDRFVGAAEAEFRSASWHRVGVAGFAGLGASHALSQRAGGMHLLPTVGAGVRYLLQPAERLTVRVDYARGRHGGGLYVALGEAF
ncbi:MAG: hypothetical protein JNJ98_16430 [Gemmatimonadetes bacterium]|nr:hypothetical protein [Gemmatimonadota bacterium]